MNTTTIYAVLAIALFLNLNCSKNTSVNSPNDNNNTTGNGTLTAKINGTSFVSGTYNPGGNLTGYNLGAYAQLLYNSGYIQFTINGDKTSTQDRFNLVFVGTVPPKAGTTYSTTNTMNNTVGISLNYFKFDASVGVIEYHWATDAAHSGSLTITKFDTVTNLTSGTFSFSGKEKNVNTTGDTTTVTITNGTFTNLTITR